MNRGEGKSLFFESREQKGNFYLSEELLPSGTSRVVALAPKELRGSGPEVEGPRSAVGTWRLSWPNPSSFLPVTIKPVIFSRVRLLDHQPLNRAQPAHNT